MSATLQIIDPEGRARAVPFAGMQMSLGRAADNQVVLDHAAGGVSSHHCVIGLDPTNTFVIPKRWVASLRPCWKVSLASNASFWALARSGVRNIVTP